MNQSKRSNLIIALVVIILVIIAIVWYGKTPSNNNTGNENTASNEPVVASSETKKISNSISEYQNSELGFSVKYPTAWEKEEVGSGVNFVIPVGKDQVTTIGNLQGIVQVQGGNCEFPPVTTVKDRNTMKVGDYTFNTISMTNTVQGRNYFNRMYSLKTNGACYMFSFASITLPPSAKKLTGSAATQAQNNNKAIIETADKDFTEVVKSFAVVVGPQGIDETKAPVKK